MIPTTDSASFKQNQNWPFRIVGMGASAGGLQAFRKVLEVLPQEPGFAIVLIQHLDPHYESSLVEILTPDCRIPLSTIKDGMGIENNHVYVMPSHAEVTLNSRRFELTPRDPGQTIAHSIDKFFNSLAKEVKSQAIGVILSGNGEDGCQGIQSLRHQDAITIVQNPATAQHRDLPMRALETACVDLVLEPQEIGLKLCSLAKLTPAAIAFDSLEEGKSNETDEQEFITILDIMQDAFHVEFSKYKPSTIRRRILRRLSMLGIKNLTEYGLLLEKSRQEKQLLYDSLLINVTAFFRDKEVFHQLPDQVFKSLLKDRADNDTIRIWVAGCAMGEEAYSLLMVLLDLMEETKQSYPIQLFATDISEKALSKARLGLYSEKSVVDVSPQRLQKYFRKTDQGYQVNTSLRELCVFAMHNVAVDPPFSKVDLISCRNVLIYLNTYLQRRVFYSFHYALKPLGYLILGASESIGSHTELFSTIDMTQRIYKKLNTKTLPLFDMPILVPTDRRRSPHPQIENFNIRDNDSLAALRAETERLILQTYSPCAVLVNQKMEIILALGDTSNFLSLPTGVASLNLFRMVRLEWASALRVGIQKVKASGQSYQTWVQRPGEAQSIQDILIEMVPMKNRQIDDLKILIVFHRPSLHGRNSAKRNVRDLFSKSFWSRRSIDGERKSESLQKELERAQAHVQLMEQTLQATIDAHSLVHEELKATSEEVISSNEELQSTNEELETSREELQSTNEELNTVNDELRNRNMELQATNNDLINLLNSSNLAIIMLDRTNKIRRFTQMAQNLFNLIPADIGRCITDINLHFPTIELPKIVSDVLSKLSPVEQEVCSENDQWYLVRVQPYRTLDDRIDGTVVSFIDIDLLQRAKNYACIVVEAAREPMLVLDLQFNVIAGNDSFCQTFQVNKSSVEGASLFTLQGGIWDQPQVRTILSEISRDPDHLHDREILLELPSGLKQRLQISATKIRLGNLKIDVILLAIKDVSESQKIQGLRKKWALIFEQNDNPIAITEEDGETIEIVNQAFASHLGYCIQDLLQTKIIDLFPAEERSLWASQAKITLQTTPLQFESNLLRSDQSLIPVSFHAQVITDELGNPICRMIQTIDLTVRRSSEAQFQTIFESAPHSMLMTLDDGTIILANDALKKVFGYRHEDLIGLKITSLIPTSLQKTADEVFFSQNFLPKDGTIPTISEFIGRRQSGEQFSLELRLTQLHTREGRYFVGSILDITEHKRVEDFEREAKRQAEAANRSKSDFIANISHEIRTPLGAILGFTELLSTEKVDRTERLAFVSNIRRNIENLTEIIDELLDLSKIEAGKIEINVTSQELLPLVTDIATSMQARAHEKNLGFSVRFHGLLPRTIETDPIRLRQILVNVTGNAIKFTSHGEVELIVKLEHSTELTYLKPVLKFFIRDTGLGISQEQSQRIFQPFIQADSSITRRFGGTGLGLSLSKRLAQLLGGDVSLQESIEEVGSTFLISIDPGPCHISDLVLQTAEHNLLTATTLAVLPQGTSLKGIRVLIAEDAPDLQAIFAHILSLNGALVKTAENGSIALEHIRSGVFDLILMDIQMPVMDGYQALKILKDEGYTTPALALTAHAMRGEREKCLAAGFVTHIIKPVTAQGLVDAVAKYATVGKERT